MLPPTANEHQTTRNLGPIADAGTIPAAHPVDLDAALNVQWNANDLIDESRAAVAGKNGGSPRTGNRQHSPLMCPTSSHPVEKNEP
jgi:hypothetical protein